MCRPSDARRRNSFSKRPAYVGGANLLTRRASWRSPSVRTSSSRAGAAGHAPNAIAHGVVVASSETTSPTTFCSCSGRRTSERRWPIDFPPSCVVVAVVSNEAVLSHYGQPADRPGLPGRREQAGETVGRCMPDGRSRPVRARLTDAADPHSVAATPAEVASLKIAVVVFSESDR